MTYPQGGLPPLISRRYLEAFLQIPSGTLPADTAYAAVRGASGAVRDECGWRIDHEVVTDYKPSGDGSSLLLLPTARLISVERVAVDGDVWEPYVPGEGETPYWDYSVLISAAAIRARGFRTWPPEGGSIEIDFTHGYELDIEEESPGVEPMSYGLPDGLERIIVAVAGRSLTNPSGYSTIKVGGISETFAGAGIPSSFVLSETERNDLAPYRVEV